LENDKTDEGRVQTQMYVAMQIAAALSAFASLSYLYSDEIIKNFKIESPLSWALFQTSDLIVAGHQIGEGNCFCQN
jgi:methionyl-tRNA synthetase